MKQVSQGSSRLLNAVDIRPATVDDLAAARKLQAAAFRAFTSADCSEEESAAIHALLDSPAIVDTLRGQALYMAWLEHLPVAMAGWQMADNNGRAARLSAVAVDPMFGFMGLGRLMVGHVERCAAKAGYRDMVVQATAGMEGFFARLGFETTAHSVRTVGSVSKRSASMRVSYLRKPLPRPTRTTVQGRGPAGAPSEAGQAVAPGGDGRVSGGTRSASGGHIVHAAPVLSKASH